MTFYIDKSYMCPFVFTSLCYGKAQGEGVILSPLNFSALVNYSLSHVSARPCYLFPLYQPTVYIYIWKLAWNSRLCQSHVTKSHMNV